MRRNPGIIAFTVAVLLSLGWLASTTRLGDGGRALALFIGAVGTAVILLGLAWRAHRTGALFPNRCRTCEHAMTALRPGELRPPAEAERPSPRRWRCRHCGRLA